ncbi:MAG TPA: hypothetical protein VII06_29225 [Chloroflexota bacterium]
MPGFTPEALGLTIPQRMLLQATEVIQRPLRALRHSRRAGRGRAERSA